MLVALTPLLLSLTSSGSRLASHPRLETLERAQASSVFRIPKFLSAEEMTQLHEAAATVRQDVGEQDLHNRQGAPVGSWHTVFLNNRLAELLPNLHDKLFAAAREADAETGGLLDSERHELSLRVAEYHAVTEAGGIPMHKHHDFGSLLTLDVMLSDPSSDFKGGDFCTLEPDGTLKRHAFEYGDLIIFQSHKYHCVQPVTSGRRNVLVCEIWEGLSRPCPRRCNTPWGPCECQFAAPPPTYIVEGKESFSELKPTLKLMAKSAEELTEMMERGRAAADPAAEVPIAMIGTHRLWMRRQKLDKERAVARGWTK